MPRSIFLSPHADDEILFGAFTILKYRPRVFICFGSEGDYGSMKTRLAESNVAQQVLTQDWTAGVSMLREPTLDALYELDAAKPDIVWAPSPMCSHKDHLALHRAACLVFGDRVRMYGTYMLDANGDPVKERNESKRAPIDDRMWIARKHAALQCFVSQLTHPRASVFFERFDLSEYAEQP